MATDDINEVGDVLPRTVAALLELIARERGALERAVTGMSEDAFESTAGGWSAKDHLAHVSEWERRLIGEIRGEREVERFGLNDVDFEAANTDILNAMLHERHRADSAETVRAEFRDSGEAIRATLAALTDADLMKPVRPDDPDVDTLVELIGWDTFKHYGEHVAAITGHE